jgi:hypothetical protein
MHADDPGDRRRRTGCRKDTCPRWSRRRQHAYRHRQGAEIELGDSDVSVERVPIGIIVDSAPQVQTEGDATILPVLEERLVVEKRLVLIEKVRITN